jgi:hypothetical protein
MFPLHVDLSTLLISKVIYSLALQLGNHSGPLVGRKHPLPSFDMDCYLRLVGQPQLHGAERNNDRLRQIIRLKNLLQLAITLTDTIFGGLWYLNIDQTPRV